MVAALVAAPLMAMPMVAIMPGTSLADKPVHIRIAALKCGQAAITLATQTQPLTRRAGLA